MAWELAEVLGSVWQWGVGSIAEQLGYCSHILESGADRAYMWGTGRLARTVPC